MKILTRLKACGQAPGQRTNSHGYTSFELLFIPRPYLKVGLNLDLEIKH